MDEVRRHRFDLSTAVAESEATGTAPETQPLVGVRGTEGRADAGE